MKNNIKSLYNSSLFRLSFNLINFSDRFTVKGGVQMVNILKGLITVCTRCTSGRIRFIVLFIWKVKLLLRSQGVKGTVKYLKAAGTMVQQAIGGQKVDDLGKLGTRVARTRSGLPRFIPSQLRTLIRSGDPTTVKIVLTLINVFRVFEFPGTLKLSTITAPNKGHGGLNNQIRSFIPLFISRFVRPRFSRDWLLSKLQQYSSESLAGIFKGGPGVIGAFGEFNSLPRILVRAYKALLGAPVLKESLDTLWSYMPPVFKRVVIPNMDHLFKLEQDLKRTVIKPLPYLGKLGLKEEAAGKIRVFAMVDAWTQWTLNPFHKLLFTILDGIRMDGTFDQLKPLQFLLSKRSLFSLDLTAATDRIPLDLQRALVGELISHEFAGAWANLLVGRTYRLHNGDKPFTELRYAVGQPMGALSSWAMLAFTHHFLVQCAAWRAGHAKDRLFLDYAVLGDDLVIADWKVAKQYLVILDSLGVECGLHKSLLSPKGLALEFAKRTFYKGADVSPVPVREFYAASRNLGACVEFMKKYHISISTILQALGAGWKVRSWLNKPLGKLPSRVRLLVLAINIPTTPEEVTKFFELGQPREPRFVNATVDVMSTIAKTEGKRLITKLMLSANEAAFGKDPNLWARESAAALVLSTIKNLPEDFEPTLEYVDTLKAAIKAGYVSKSDVQYLFRTLSDVLHNIINLTWFDAKLGLVDDTKRDIKKLHDLPTQDLPSLFMGIVEAQHNVAARNENAFATSRPNPAHVQGILSPEMVRFWKRWSAVIQGSQPLTGDNATDPR
nr:MAG: putative RNA-dependent RNA polymerase [Mitoviridae sp.]